MEYSGTEHRAKSNNRCLALESNRFDRSDMLAGSVALKPIIQIISSASYLLETEMRSIEHQINHNKEHLDKRNRSTICLYFLVTKWSIFEQL